MKRMTLNRMAFLGAAIVLALFLTACEQKTISQILAEPDRYYRKEVGIVGKVVDSYSVMGRGAYRVDDGTGKMWVISEKGVPRKGAQVGVKGKIKDGFNLGGVVRIPEAFSSGLVMIESSHKAK